jgi:5'-3' exoribonuclease 1
VLTAAQRAIFDQVRAFVMQYRGAPTTTIASARLTIPNTFPAADRVFIGKLADDLHLSLTWDEYDEEDNNLVTWRLPGALDAPLPEDPPVVDGEDGEDGEWEDVGEANAAVDRVLKKYDQARVMTEDGEGDFDARYEASIKEKMDEWKRGYYKVGLATTDSVLWLADRLL